MNGWQLAFQTFGGLALFLYGISALSSGLQKVAGKKLKEILANMTKNRMAGVAVGTAVTGIIQSSTAVTVIAVGFVNAGLLSLDRGISIILGANLGTTFTAQLIAFKITDAALLFVGIGGLMNLFAKRKNWQWVGYSIFGFGLLFFGLNTIIGTFSFLRSDPVFHGLFVLFSQNHLLAILGGCVLTFVIQSSTATIGIIQALAVAGVIDFTTAIPLVLGGNLGTTLTAQIAAIGASRNAKRLALSHVMFNVLSVAIFMAFWFIPRRVAYMPEDHSTPLFLWFIDKITPGKVFLTGENISRHVANAHLFFNLISVAAFIPLVNWLARLVTWMVPGKDEEMLDSAPRFIDKRFTGMLSVALVQAEKEVLRMMDISRETVKLSLEGFFDKTKQDFKGVQTREQIVDDLQTEITEYLVSLESTALNRNEAVHLNCLLHLVNDVEKISDYAMNIVSLVEDSLNNNIKFSAKAREEIRIMVEDVDKECELSVKAFVENNKIYAAEALELEDRIDQEKEDFRKNHLERLKSKKCSIEAGAIFNDIVNNLERISDHAVKFAKWVENPHLRK